MRLDLYELSRRNLLSLLSKLDQPTSARMLMTRRAYVDGALCDDRVLVVQVEPDAVHYAEREPPGPMSQQTEALLKTRLDDEPDTNGQRTGDGA